MAAGNIGLFDLPVEMIDKILSYLSFDQIAKARAVSRSFNSICSDKLNKGFVALEKYHSKCLKAVKAKLPRRESERKHHPLARHCDILMAVETRYSMLSMTFTKYIDMQHCCFIPGKVLDEAFRVLRIVNSTSSRSSTTMQYPVLPRPYELLQEYRDISSMAIEHFDDKILPTIREKMRLENSLLFCYKNKLSRLQLQQATKTHVLQANTSVGSSTTNPAPSSSCCHSNLIVHKAHHPAVNLVKALHTTIEKCNFTRKAVGNLHKNIITETNKVKIQNIMLKRKYCQLKCVTMQLRRELAETKNTVSALTSDINQLKSEKTSSEASLSNDETISPTMKLYKLFHHTNLKCNSASRAVVSLDRNMKIMARRLRIQDALLRQSLSKNGCRRQKRREKNNWTTDSVSSPNVNQMHVESSSSRGVKRKLILEEEKEKLVEKKKC